MTGKVFAFALLALPGCLIAQQMPVMNLQQQRTQQGVAPGSGSEQTSPAHDTMTLQEPENPGHVTGSSLPTPDLLASVAARGQLTLDDFEKMAEHINPTLAQARADVLRAQQQGRQAALYPNPSIGYSGEHIRGGSYGAGEQGAYLQQEIVLGGKLGLRRNIYTQQVQANQTGVEEQLFRVRGGVEQAFYTALTSQAEVAVRQQLLKVALDASETTHRLASLGQADAPDILQSEVEAERAKVDFMNAQRSFLRDFAVLAAVAGAQQLPPAPLKGNLENLPALDTEQQVAAVIAESPAVKRAQQEVAVAEARLKEAHREPVPNLTLRAGEWYSGEITEGTQRAAGPMSFASASIDLPIWNRNQGNIEAAKAELERAREDVVRTQLSLKREAEPLAQEYLSARDQADAYRTGLIPRARRAYELYLMKYQQMAAAYPQVLLSQRTLFQLQIGYLDSLNQAWHYSVALRNYTLTGGLMQPMPDDTDSTTINLPNGGNSE